MLNAQETFLTMDKNVSVKLDSPRSESDVNKLVRMMSWLMTVDYVTHAPLTKLFQKENVFADQAMLEMLTLEFANLPALLVNSNIKADVLNAH